MEDSKMLETAILSFLCGGYISHSKWIYNIQVSEEQKKNTITLLKLLVNTDGESRSRTKLAKTNRKLHLN